jgi:hypothetical protein
LITDCVAAAIIICRNPVFNKPACRAFYKKKSSEIKFQTGNAYTSAEIFDVIPIKEVGTTSLSSAVVF